MLSIAHKIIKEINRSKSVSYKETMKTSVYWPFKVK